MAVARAISPAYTSSPRSVWRPAPATSATTISHSVGLWIPPVSATAAVIAERMATSPAKNQYSGLRRDGNTAPIATTTAAAAAYGTRNTMPILTASTTDSGAHVTSTAALAG